MLSAKGKRVELGVERAGVVEPLLPPPALNEGFSERAKVCFVGSAAAGEHTLRIDDAPILPGEPGPGPQRWSWKPAFYAGEVRVELVDQDDRIVGSWRLDVSPSAEKLGRDIFREMIAEIADYDPDLVVGKEPARTQLGALGGKEDPLVALTRLRSRYAALRRVLLAIARDPIRTLRARRSLVPLHAVRRADRRTAMGVLRQPALLAAVGAIPADAVDMPAHSLLADVPDVERDLDCPANRCVLAMLRALMLRCAHTHDILERRVSEEEHSDTVSGLSDRWPVWSTELTEIRERLLRSSRRAPFSEVRHAEITVAGLNAVSAHPLYARFWRLAWEALRKGVQGPAVDELIPLSPTWEIYERWCFVELRQQLERWLPDLSWKRVSPTLHEGREPGARLVTLALQPKFPCTNGDVKEGFWSVSRKRVPDIVLSWSGEGTPGFIVLDAKYRVSRPSVLEAMNSAHLYQDALRFGDHRPLLSLLLVPSGGGAPWLEEASFVNEHRVGVVSLRKGAKPPKWVRDVLVGACEIVREDMIPSVVRRSGLRVSS